MKYFYLHTLAKAINLLQYSRCLAAYVLGSFLRLKGNKVQTLFLVLIVQNGDVAVDGTLNRGKKFVYLKFKVKLIQRFPVSDTSSLPFAARNVVCLPHESLFF